MTVASAGATAGCEGGNETSRVRLTTTRGGPSKANTCPLTTGGQIILAFNQESYGWPDGFKRGNCGIDDRASSGHPI